jgi:excisionase family DNA binding protein
MSSSTGGERVTRRLLTPEQAAEALGIGRSLLYELLRAGELQSVRIGACRRIPVAALDEYVEELRSREQEPAGAPLR